MKVGPREEDWVLCHVEWNRDASMKWWSKSPKEIPSFLLQCWSTPWSLLEGLLNGFPLHKKDVLSFPLLDWMITWQFLQASLAGDRYLASKEEVMWFWALVMVIAWGQDSMNSNIGDATDLAKWPAALTKTFQGKFFHLQTGTFCTYLPSFTGWFQRVNIYKADGVHGTWWTSVNISSYLLILNVFKFISLVWKEGNMNPIPSRGVV